MMKMSNFKNIENVEKIENYVDWRKVKFKKMIKKNFEFEKYEFENQLCRNK